MQRLLLRSSGITQTRYTAVFLVDLTGYIKVTRKSMSQGVFATGFEGSSSPDL